MEENYHKDHLACHNCDKKLVACRYIVKDENPHCIPCYQELYAHNCEECKKPIGPDYKVCNFVSWNICNIKWMNFNDSRSSCRDLYCVVLFFCLSMNLKLFITFVTIHFLDEQKDHGSSLQHGEDKLCFNSDG